MGYDIWLQESTAHIPRANRSEVLRIWQDANRSDRGKRGGSPQQPTLLGVPDDWTGLDEHQIAEGMGFEMEENNGDLWFARFEDRTGDERYLLNQVGHLLVGYMRFVGEDDYHYGYWFGPTGMHTADGHITYGPLHRVIDPPQRDTGLGLTR